MATLRITEAPVLGQCGHALHDLQTQLLFGGRDLVERLLRQHLMRQRLDRLAQREIDVADLTHGLVGVLDLVHQDRVHRDADRVFRLQLLGLELLGLHPHVDFGNFSSRIGLHTYEPGMRMSSFWSVMPCLDLTPAKPSGTTISSMTRIDSPKNLL